MFRLALSSHIYSCFSRHQSWHFSLLALRNTCCGNACLGVQVSSKYGTWYSEQVILQFMCIGSLAGVTYLRYTVLMSSNKSKTAVHCCDSALSVLVMLVSRNVFHVVISLAVFCLYTHFILADQISCRSYVGSVYRMRSLAVSYSLAYPRAFDTCVFERWISLSGKTRPL